MLHVHFSHCQVFEEMGSDRKCTSLTSLPVCHPVPPYDVLRHILGFLSKQSEGFSKGGVDCHVSPGSWSVFRAVNSWRLMTNFEQKWLNNTTNGTLTDLKEEGCQWGLENFC